MSPAASRALWLATICLVAGSLAAQGTGVITGTVSDSTGHPLADAILTATGTHQTARSDAAGRFRFAAVSAGSDSVRARLFGFRPAELSVSLGAGDSVHLTITLRTLPIQLGAIQVTGTKHAQTQAEAMTTIALVSDTALRQRAINTPDEAVTFVPAVQMIDGQVNIRGSSGFGEGVGSRVLLLVDGVPMNQADRGGINWDVLAVDEIDHIEIAKGAGSALYGSSAFGGVVNMITRDPPEGFHMRFRATGGSYANPAHDVWQFRDFTGFQEGGDASVSYGTPAVRGAFSAGGRHQDGYREQDVANHWQTAGKLQWRPDPVTRIDLSGSWASDQYGVYEPWCTNDAPNTCPNLRGQYYQPYMIRDSNRGNFTRSDKGIGNVVVTRRSSEQLTWVARISGFRTAFTDEYPNRSPSTEDVSIATGYGAEGRVVARPDEHRTVTVGVEGSYDHDWSNVFSGDTVPSSFATHSQVAFAGYAEAEQAFGSLRLTLGARVDFISVDGGALTSVVSPRAGLVLLDRHGSWRVSAGRAFRAPSLAERFVTTYALGIPVIPNPDLAPEDGWTGEVGRLFIPSSRLSLDLAGFWTEANQLIEPTVLSAGKLKIQFQNIGRARLAGLDFTVTAVPLTPNLTTTASYMYLYARDLNQDAPLLFRPKHLATFTADYRWRALGVGADVRISSRFDSVGLYETDPRVGQETVDLRASWSQGPWTARIKVGNAFNYIYNLAPRVLEPVRTLTLVLTWNR